MTARRDTLTTISVGLLVLASRLPFLAHGYGVDADAWSLAHSARALSLSGGWESSRLPGQPVQEMVCALLWRGGPLALNGATAVLSALAAVQLLLCARRLGLRAPVLVALGFAFTPLVFVHSTTAMDYLWAVAFLLWALRCALSGRVLLAGVLLAVAVGCRSTTALLFAPLALVVARVSGRERRPRALVGFTLLSGLLGAAFYVPALVTHGNLLPRHFFPYPRWTSLLRDLSVDVWGGFGSVALLAVFVATALRWSEVRAALRSEPGRLMALPCAIAVLLVLAAYLMLPHEAGYLIPAVPFVLLWLGIVARPAGLAVLLVALLLSNAVDVGPRGPGRGAILADRAQRVREGELLPRILRRSEELEPGSAIVCGPWLQRVSLFVEPAEDRVDWVFALTPELHAARYAAGPARIYYAPGILDWHRRLFELDLEGVGARPLVQSP